MTGRLVPLHVFFFFFSSYRSFGDVKVSAFACFFFSSYRSFGDGKVSAFACFFLEL